jgi:GAF domain-containing protein
MLSRVNGALGSDADSHARAQHWTDVRQRIGALIADETDFVAALSTIACELHHAFEHHHWTGFYRVIAPRLLAVGPYQGGHGCLRIPFERGVCGAAARTRQTQRLGDVHAFADHIACSATTRSELVVPILDRRGETIAVLDIDSDLPDAFGEIDQRQAEALCAELGARFG